MNAPRWGAAGLLLVAMVADFLLVRHVALDTHGYGLAFVIGGPLGLLLAFALALVMAPLGMRRSVVVAAILLFGWFGAFIAGTMFRTCDPGMSPFILTELLPMIVPGEVVISGIFFVCVPALLLIGFLVNRLAWRWLNPYAYIILVAAIPVVSVVTYFVEGAFGAHSSPGNCVI